MTRHWLRLAVIGLIVAGSGLVVLALGYSFTAVVLAWVLAAALTWAPVLITLESMARERRERRNA